ncbi:MAG: hypothetical protein HRT69_17390 [Flavobacteriaceae bacterium]|nr:hypothetical protein [Flavobacteriaceae bacterium]
MTINIFFRYSILLLTCNTSAQVGIGTTSPTSTLHVVGSIDPLRLEGVQDESLANINQANNTTKTSEVLVCNSLGVFKKVKPEYLDVEAYVSINEFLRSEPIIIPPSGNFKGNVVYIVPSEYDGFIVESVTYRVMSTGDNFTAGLAKDSNGIETNLALTTTIGAIYTSTIVGGAISVTTGDAIYTTLSGTTPATQPKGLSCTLRLIKP